MKVMKANRAIVMVAANQQASNLSNYNHNMSIGCNAFWSIEATAGGIIASASVMMSPCKIVE